MDEQIADTKHRRKPLVAAFLSFIAFSLGYVYCGRIARGFVFVFFGLIFVPIISFAVLAELSRINMVIIVVSTLISLLIGLAAIIDSYCIAKHTKPDYELKEYNRWYVYAIFYCLITIYAKQITLDIKSNLMEAFRVPTLSMYPNIEYHDRFLANKKAYKKDDPKRGDIIVFMSPENRNEVWCKRVVAVAGDTIEMKNNQLIINGEELKRVELYPITYVDKDSNNRDVNVEGELFVEKNGEVRYEIFLTDKYDSKRFPRNLGDFPKTTVPKNYCFVLGDNRSLSMDSRHFGPIPLSTVKGRAEYLYWPAKGWSRIGEMK
jgi:signal peptidase I